MTVISATFSATGTSSVATVVDKVAVSIARDSWSGLIDLERSVDGGTKWRQVKQYTFGTEEVIDDAEGVQYRLKCVALTAGTVAYDLRY